MDFGNIFLYSQINAVFMLNDFVEEWPEGVAKRVTIDHPDNIPHSGCGALIIDMDDNGKTIDSYFEGTRNKVYVLRPKTYQF
jgi:hypothetical protein